jgi:protein O-GlcNAc transferase
MPEPQSDTPKTMSLPDAIRQAMELHRQGRLTEAENLYAAILKAKPGNFDALHMLGVLKHQRGESAEGLRSIAAALKVKPDSAEALSNHGLVLRALGRHEEALASYDRALAITPGFAGALNNRGNALTELGRYEEALASFERALAIKPDYAETMENRGTALQALGRSEEALASFEQALAIKPNQAQTLNNRGNVLQALGRHKEAVASYERALAVNPGYADALNNRGVALGWLKLHQEALASFDAALAIKPGYAEALNNRGTPLKALGRPGEALASYERALAIKPDYPEALNNRGAALQALGRHEEALAGYDRALAIKPDYAEAINNRGTALQALRSHEAALASFDAALAIKPDYADALNNRGLALQELKRHGEALADYGRALAIKPDYAEALYNRSNVLRALNRYEDAIEDFKRLLQIKPDFAYLKGKLLYSQMHCCIWDKFAADAARLVADVQDGKPCATPFELVAVSQSPADLLRCSQILVRDKFPPAPSPVWRGERYRHDKIRVAYLSADFRDHATAYLMAGLFELHDRKRFETIAISFGPDASGEMHTRLKKSFDHFPDLRGKSDRDVANMIRTLEADIAVDLKGFTTDARPGILALRPAPIQVNYLGFPGTMGADYIDYIIADRWIIPEEDQKYYTEKAVYLPDSYQVNDSKRRIAKQKPSRAKSGLPETGFVFCSFNNNYKITPFMFDIWMRLLHRVEGSVLWLLEGNAAAVRNLRREAEKRGVAPDRLVFAPRMKLADHLARHRLADLFLDALPCNAHTTASDALWAGLPVLTCLGSTFAGRVAGSLLNAAGLPELIAHSLADYEALALRLAQDKKALAKIKTKLTRHRKTCPLFDTDRFRRHIEAAYVTMWERYQRGEPPASFSVPGSPPVEQR